MTPAQALHRYATDRDAEAFHWLVQTYQPMVFGVCWRILRSRADADDAAQETFLRLARSAGEVRSNVAAWLHACARTSALMLRRAESARRRHEDAAGGEHAVAAAAAEAQSDEQRGFAEIAGLVDACLAELSADDRDLLVQRFYLDRSQADIADGLGISRVAVGKRLDKAVERLRSRYAARAGAAVGALVLGALAQAQAAVPYVANPKLGALALSGVGGAVPAAGAGLGLAGWLAAAVLVGGAGVAGVAIAARGASAPAASGEPGVAPAAWVEPAPAAPAVQAPVAAKPPSAPVVGAVAEVLPARTWPWLRGTGRPSDLICAGTWWRLEADGAVRASADGGLAWQEPAAGSAAARSFGSAGAALRGTDGGVASGQAMVLFGGAAASRFQHLAPVSARAAWALAVDGLHRSEDGGASWQSAAPLGRLLAAAGLRSGQVRAIAAAGPDEVAVTVSSSQRLVADTGSLALIARERGERLLHSSDAGATWRLLASEESAATADLRWHAGRLWWLREELAFGPPERLPRPSAEPAAPAPRPPTVAPRPSPPPAPTERSAVTVPLAELVSWPVIGRALALAVVDDIGGGGRRWSLPLATREAGRHRLIAHAGAPLAVAVGLDQTLPGGPTLLTLDGQAIADGAPAGGGASLTVHDVAALDDQRWLAAAADGRNGVVLYSGDGGRTWTVLDGLDLAAAAHTAPPTPANPSGQALPPAWVPIALAVEGPTSFLITLGHDRVAPERPAVQGGRVLRVTLAEQ